MEGGRLSEIFVAGHRGLVGSAIVRRLKKDGITPIVRTHAELDLTDQKAVDSFFASNQIDQVYLAAAKVGGILANDTYPAEFIYVNTMIACNVIHAAYKYKVKKLLNLGSSCIYPRECPQPMKEESLLTGPLEPTNEAYAVAKIAAIKLCTYYNKQYGTNFLSVMPTNLYGPGDNFDLEKSHVMPAMIRKFLEQDTVTLWGTGKPKREFLFIDDLADAVVFLMENKDADEVGEFVNVGTGKEITIKELASLIASETGFTGSVEWDSSKPDGTMLKRLDVSRMDSLGWTAKTSLREGVKKTVEWYREIARE